MSHTTISQRELQLYPLFINQEEADRLFLTLVQQLNWRQDQIKMFGKCVNIPRLQCFQGDPGIKYHYSGLSLKSAPWHPLIKTIKQRIEVLSGHRFNSVLINYYRNGQDSMGWHSDDEPELGKNPVIASLSLGQQRRFLFRHRFDKTISPQEYLLNSGSLLIMAGQLQHNWQHSVPKTRRPSEGRINLTFRWTYTTDTEME
ncbi:alpha-ketoglutarate-dependent dioxygenase AlkB family protein [Amphritea japonica]|uniref:alpha-ketoglutarate-dependent dioxygenase AlkB family protein n=1 Tax=Amphritea japonica TaxID=452627 RepID=UPI000475797E|nr:alpha-ketoglutarate-dependent dioxygenase AlkB [Amphritea japonica]